jgi:hypothetical protein
MSYAKVIAVLPRHNALLQKYIEIQMFYFSYNLEHII